jgi:hypothetical protein
MEWCQRSSLSSSARIATVSISASAGTRLRRRLRMVSRAVSARRELPLARTPKQFAAAAWCASCASSPATLPFFLSHSRTAMSRIEDTGTLRRPAACSRSDLIFSGSRQQYASAFMHYSVADQQPGVFRQLLKSVSHRSFLLPADAAVSESRFGLTKTAKLKDQRPSFSVKSRTCCPGLPWFRAARSDTRTRAAALPRPEAASRHRRDAAPDVISTYR